jgi:hypothetical protein
MTSTDEVLNDIAVGGCSLSAVGLVDAVGNRAFVERGVTWYQWHCRLPETAGHRLQVNTLVPKLTMHNI